MSPQRLNLSVETDRPRTGVGRLWPFLGPGVLVSVGYMDPGNWATDLEGGARFGYQLLWVLAASNLIALMLQTLAARLGLVRGLDLAQACREMYPRPAVYMLWVLCEIAIIACDLAEVIGSAVALNLLFNIPMLWGAAITVLDVLLILMLQRFGARRLEAVALAMVLTIAACFAVDSISCSQTGHGRLVVCGRRSTARVCTSQSASSVQRSCRITSTCIPPSSKHASLLLDAMRVPARCALPLSTRFFAQLCVFHQCRYLDRVGRGLFPQRNGGRRFARSASSSRPAARGEPCVRIVRYRAAMLRAGSDDHRYSRRPDRHGGLSAAASFAYRAAIVDPLARRRAGYRRPEKRR